MLFLSVYNIVLKFFISDINSGKEDFRAYIPAVFAVGLLVFGYFLLNSKDVRFGESTLGYHLALLLLVILLTYTTYVAYRDGPLSVVVPVMGMAIAGTAILAALFLGEQLTAARIIGIALAFFAILVLSFEKSVNLFLSKFLPL